MEHKRARGLRHGVLLAAGAALLALAAAHVHAAETPIKIALIADKTGPLKPTPNKHRPASPWGSITPPAAQ
jgi:hypothetical protein